jgi:6,7-dimethyl-8-ribityllumazine synthase
MATTLKKLSDYSPLSTSFNPTNYKIGILVSEWNTEVTEALFEGALQTLIKEGVPKENIVKDYVPGSYELPLGAQIMMEKAQMDAVICLGCVIQGETRHFEFICQTVAKGIMDVNLKFSRPVIFGVLTTDNQEQALARAGGKYGNKGVEAAAAALKMLALVH